MRRTNISIIHPYLSNEETQHIVEKIMKGERFVLKNVKGKDTWVWNGWDKDVVPCICCIYEEKELILQLFLNDFNIGVEFDMQYNLLFRENKRKLKMLAEEIEGRIYSCNNLNYLKHVNGIVWYKYTGVYLTGLRKAFIRNLIRFLWRFE